MPKWLASAVYVQGLSHITSNKACQDYCIARRFGEVHILALSDGAGSCEYSQLGARAACIGFVRVVKKMLDTLLSDGANLDSFLENSSENEWRFAIEGARECIERQAIKLSLDARKSMSCTFLGAIVGRYASVVLQVGDGAWVAEVEPSIIGCVTVPQNGEYGNETYFITQSDWSDYLQFVRIPKLHGLRSLVGCSDGVERLCINFPRANSDQWVFSAFV